MDLRPFAESLGELASLDEAEMNEGIRREIETVANTTASKAVVELLRSATETVDGQRTYREGFERRLMKAWYKPLVLYELVQTLCGEFGADLNKRMRPQAAMSLDFVFDVLTRLHIRACLTASAIGALLRSGHATDANTRWRTLNELTTVAYFVSEHGQDVARRYLEHQLIDRYRAALEYQQFAKRLGERPLTKREMDRYSRERDVLVETYGRAYAQDYGWAAQALRSSRPRFADIRDATQLDHWRPYVRLANYGIHGAARGAFFDLGSHQSLKTIVAGPTHFGLADPGVHSLNSLVQITTVLLGHCQASLNRMSSQRGHARRLTNQLIILTQIRMLQMLLEVAAEAFGDANAIGEKVPPRVGRPPKVWRGIGRTSV